MLRPWILLPALSLIAQAFSDIDSVPCDSGPRLPRDLMCANMSPASSNFVHSTVTAIPSSEYSREHAVSFAETSVSRPETSFQSFDDANLHLKVGQHHRIIKRQTGRTFLGGCESYQLSRIMGHVMGSLTSNNRMRLGDVAKVLQQYVQRATGRSHEIIIGRGDMMVASHQMSEWNSCKMRIGEYYTTVYETPVQYNINNIQQEQILSNIDFGENLGGSGYPGQLPFPFRVYGPLEAIIDSLTIDTADFVGAGGAGACFSGDLIVETREGPKQMKELQTGDEVMSVEEGMGIANGDSVKLTSEHLIQVFDCENADTLRLVRSSEVTTGHCLISIRSPFRKISIGRVTNLTKVYERGIYSPLTSTGDIIVNGVLSSCHSNLAFKTLQQSLFNGYRYLYRLLSFILPEEGSLPIGLTSLARAIDLFIPAKPIFI